MEDMRKTVGIIGFGNMGSSIAGGVKSKYKVWIFDKDKEKTKDIPGVGVANTLIDLIDKTDVIILAVKPQDFTTVLNEILKNRPKNMKEKLIISIAAGITTEFIEILLRKTRVIRAMPNLPLKVGYGTICLCKGKFAKLRDLNFARALFNNLGDVLALKEKDMDSATAISGSGPGYLYDWGEGRSLKEIKQYARTFTAALTAAAKSLGFSTKLARSLAENTTKGSITYLEKTNLSPSEAKKQVTSKGGTTEAALEAIHKGGTLVDAAKAAVRRAKELSNEAQTYVTKRT